MGITEKQAETRLSGIGSSDAATILGFNKYQSPYDLWLIKTGKIEDPFEGNAATERGNRLEPVILEWAGDELGEKVVKPKATFVRGNLRANVDGCVGKYAKGSEIVEAKAMFAKGDGWGPAWSDEVPQQVMAQVIHQLVCSEAPRCYVARLAGWTGDELAIYPIDRNAEVCDLLEERLNKWWEEHVVADTPPERNENLPPVNTKLLAQINRDDQRVISVEDKLVEELIESKKAIKAAEDRYDRAREDLDRIMGDAKKARGFGYELSYSQVKGRTGIDTTRFKEAMPEAFALFSKQGKPYWKFNTPKLLKKAEDEA